MSDHHSPLSANKIQTYGCGTVEEPMPQNQEVGFESYHFSLFFLTLKECVLKQVPSGERRIKRAFLYKKWLLSPAA